MATLTYWKIDCPNDSDALSIRTKTKREAADMLASDDFSHWRECGAQAPRKVTVAYRDAFDLMLECSQMGHHGWEA